MLDFEYFYGLSRATVRAEDADHRAIAQRCLEASRRGENAAVWHQSALHFGNRCNCVPCRRAAAA